MATPQPMNISQTLAIQLAQPVILTEEQKLFREALGNVETKRAGNLSEFFTRLVHAKTIEDVTFAVKKEQEGNRIWRRDAGSKWLKRLGDFATCILVYKSVVDSAVSANPNIASPIWGSFAFILGVMKDFPAATQSLSNLEKTLRNSMSRFKEYFAAGILISPAFKQAVIDYYEVVVEFAIDVHQEFAASLGKTIIKIVHRTLKTKLEDLEKIIHHAINDVDQSRSHNQVLDLKMQLTDMRVNNTYWAASLTRNSTTNATPLRTVRSYGLPLSNQTFVGRRSYIEHIRTSLYACNGAQGRTALYGLSGMGKTQILRAYAHEQIVKRLYGLVIYIDSHDMTSVICHMRACMQINAPKELEQAAGSGPEYLAFKTWLLSQDDWLLVFDNVQCFDDIQQAIPEGDRGHILFSTQMHAEAVQMSRNPYEVTKLDSTESIALVQKLVSLSPDRNDEDPITVEKLALFADGYPLLIEQIVHNAILGGKSLEYVLEWNKNKRQLLKQGNKSSLHERNLSVGVAIMQAFELIKAQSDQAEALFMIIAYLQPSSISRNLIRNGSKQYETFLRKPFTYDRGAYKLDNGKVIDLYDQALTEPELPEPKKSNTSKLFTRSRLTDWMSRRQRTSKSDNLPADDQTLRSELLQACGPGTPIGRLFQNQYSVDDALAILMRFNIIRKLNNDSFEMHDLVSQVTKAIIEDRSRELEQQIVLTTSTMVYLTLPHPERAYLSEWRSLILRYLPHAIACQSSLKTLGILNNFSIGPELSHLIASSMLKCGLAKYDHEYRQIAPEAGAKVRQQVFEYYLQAYEGYMAGWNRLKLQGSIQHENQVFASAAKDRERLQRVTLFPNNHSYTEVHRVGRSAPWRAIQTAAKLAHLYRHEQSNPEAALRLWRRVLSFYEAAFGVDDYDTLEVKVIIYRILSEDLRQWDTAYEFSLECIKQLTDWQPESTRENPPYSDAIWEQLTHDDFVTTYGVQAAHCCMELAEQSKSAGDLGNGGALARQAIVWYDLRLRQQINSNAGEYYTQRREMMWLASAYEAAGDVQSCLYWYGRAVSCSMWKEMGMNMWIEASPQEIRDTIGTYNVAVSRLSDNLETRTLHTNGINIDLKEFLGEVDRKIEEWEASHELSLSQAIAHDEEDRVDWDALLAQPLHLEGHKSINGAQKTDSEDDKENVRPESIHA